ncbi:hypothetical protein SAMN06264855_1272 [Halorubrum vacuolatum]|uniref:Uncharacterized protein n=1 Tax=Halorubrum vacuolatum TaxID=63740 RepID=A0A238XZY7_HALVU|nr:hypothetical protein SAMN06264855_1272 [Halorubrum vacuolatum]
MCVGRTSSILLSGTSILNWILCKLFSCNQLSHSAVKFTFIDFTAGILLSEGFNRCRFTTILNCVLWDLFSCNQSFHTTSKFTFIDFTASIPFPQRFNRR